MKRPSQPHTIAAHRIIPCPCGGLARRVYVVGNEAGIHPQHGQIAWPIPTRCYCSIVCAEADGFPWLVSEPRPGRRRRAA